MRAILLILFGVAALAVTFDLATSQCPKSYAVDVPVKSPSTQPADQAANAELQELKKAYSELGNAVNALKQEQAAKVEFAAAQTPAKGRTQDSLEEVLDDYGRRIAKLEAQIANCHCGDKTVLKAVMQTPAQNRQEARKAGRWVKQCLKNERGEVVSCTNVWQEDETACSPSPLPYATPLSFQPAQSTAYSSGSCSSGSCGRRAILPRNR